MNFGSVVQSIFGGAPAAQAQAAPAPNPQGNFTPKTPGNMPVNPTTVQDINNPLLPVSATVDPNASPLDAYAKLWETDPNAKAQEKQPLFPNLDPATIAAAAKNNDFTKIITPEMQAALNKGGPEATAVMISVMNGMAQKGFGDSAVASTKLIESALAKQQETFMAALPGIIKNATMTETLRSTNPLFSNPAVAPILDMMTKQVAQKHPNLSSAEQAKMAQDYVIAFAETANPAKQTVNKTNQDTTDWGDFLK